MSAARLKALRERIDRADRKILIALRDRFATVRTLGGVKQALGLPVVQKTRWNELIADRLAWAAENDVDPRFLEKVLKLIHAESVRIQLEQRKKGRR